MRLADILDLVGTLDDTPGDSTPRARFRQHLARSVTTIGAVRDYVQECLQAKGPQYSRALQDLVNHTARLMGFEVEFGRYAGVANEIGFDGIWRAPDLDVVVEVKTTDAYAIKTHTMLDYINRLISESRLRTDGHLGLYVVGRIDPELKQLENAIVAEKRSDLLRAATVESVLSLAELVQEGQISSAEAIGLVRPGSVRVDDAVRLLARVAAGAEAAPGAVAEEAELVKEIQATPEPARPSGHPVYLMTPISDNEFGTILETLEGLLGRGWYVFGDKTPGRRTLQPGDKLCFYAATRGVVAEADVDSLPERGDVVGAVYPRDRFPWRFRVKSVRNFWETPVKGRNPDVAWAWFVLSTRQVTPHDFGLLTGKTAEQ